MKEQKGRTLRKVWIERKDPERQNTKESIDREKGRKARIPRKVWIKRKDRKEEY